MYEAVGCMDKKKKHAELQCKKSTRNDTKEGGGCSSVGHKNSVLVVVTGVRNRAPGFT